MPAAICPACRIFLASRSGFVPRLLGFLKGLGEFGRFHFILLLKELALAIVFELLLNLGYVLLELTPVALFVL